MPRRPATLAVLPAAIAFLLALCATASAVPVVDGHFPLASPTGTNNKLVAGPDGNIWVTVHGEEPGEEKDVARVTPAGVVSEFDLKGISGVENIAVGPENKMWVTAINKIASFSPADPTGTSKTFTNNEISGNNPLVAGPDGQLWIASSEGVIHLKPSEPEKESENEFPVAGLSPRDIDVTGSQLVIADAGVPRIVTMTTAGVKAEFGIGHLNGEEKLEGASQGVAGSPSGLIGFSQPGAAPEQIGLLMPPNPVQAITRDGDPFGVALGSDGAFWIALSGSTPTNVGVERLTTSGEATFLGGFPKEFSPRQITPGPNNTLWVAIEKPGVAYEVVRISGLEPPVEKKIATTTAPETKINKGPKKTVKTKGKFANVTFRFSSTTAGSTFECALVKATKKGKKAKQPKFKSCKSPKKYKLKPGKYSFSVRALSAGAADASPATSKFRVVQPAR